METIRAKSADRAYMGTLSQKFVDACRKALPVAAPEERIGYCAKNKAQEAVEKGTEELRKAGVTFGGFGLCFLIMARSVWAMRSKFKEAIAKPEVR
ncbi:MAG: hypothetical protein HY370_09310 [Proteobacteria bacterium]|nr:hypothetical protein [Pseudomonadota bacterium]